MKKHTLFELFLSFFKIGLFTFGGGYAMISLIEEECVEKKKWLSHDEMMDLLVVAESTPGPMAINCATYAGWKQAGIWGALSSTIGIVLPSFVIIYMISMFLESYMDIPLIANAFAGIRIAVGILIVRAGLNMLGKMQKKLRPRFFMLSALLIMLAANVFSLRLSSVVVMLFFGLVSLALWGLEKGRKGGAA